MIRLMKLDNQDGFTISELMIVVVITAIFTMILGIVTISYWRYGYILESDLSTISTRQNASDNLRSSIGTSSGLIIQNGTQDDHVLNADPDQASGKYWLPIHAIPGNKSAGGTGSYTPVVYYRRFSVNATGSYIMNGTQPYEDEYVLYLDGSKKTLMQRLLASPGASGNKFKTSCPPSLATSACPADKIIAENVSSIDLRYFSRTGNLIDYTSVWDSINNTYAGPDFPAVEVLELKLNVAKLPVFQKSTAVPRSTIIRIALRNA